MTSASRKGEERDTAASVIRANSGLKGREREREREEAEKEREKRDKETHNFPS